ncbi:MAG: phosphate ABC transporter permease subunit PstC, partial [Euryarchaeota archaeon]|nr:phosphate ABC transporter permease subunit PstC [Euryarchaeota archaeon]
MDRQRMQRIREFAIEKSLFLCALVSILTTLGIVLVLIFETLSFFEEVPILDFLTGTTWAPTYRPQHFG